jgi:hypothetical protein
MGMSKNLRPALVTAAFQAWLQGGRHRLKAIAALSALLALLLIRLTLAFVIKTSANQVLQHLDRYRGHIDDVGLSLWRGAYQFRGVQVESIDGKVPLPLFAARGVDIAVQWRALLRGQCVASVVLDRPAVNFVAGSRQGESQYGLGQDWFDVIHKLVVIKVERLEVEGGQIHFADPYQLPPLDLHLDAVEGVLDGLRDPRERGAGMGLPCGLSLTARLMDEAPLRLDMSMDPAASKPTFDYSVILRDLDLARLDPLFNHYLGVDVAGGELSIYSEGKADEGRFDGYLKPLVKHLKVMKPDEKISPKLAKKALVGLLAWIFRNHVRDLDATKIVLTGELGGPQASLEPHLLGAFFTLLGNAFSGSVSAKLDMETDLHEFKASPVPL